MLPNAGNSKQSFRYTFPYIGLCQVWYLIVVIPVICLLPYYDFCQKFRYVRPSDTFVIIMGTFPSISNPRRSPDLHLLFCACLHLGNTVWCYLPVKYNICIVPRLVYPQLYFTDNTHFSRHQNGRKHRQRFW